MNVGLQLAQAQSIDPADMYFFWNSVEITDGGVYPVALNDPHTFRFEPGFDVYGYVYRLQDLGSSDPEREIVPYSEVEVETIDENGDPVVDTYDVLSWPSPGVYEVDFYEIPPAFPTRVSPDIMQRLQRSLSYYIGIPTVYAQEVPEHWNFAKTIRFQVIATEEDPPTIGDLGQFKLFGVDAVVEGETFVGNTAVFKAEPSDPLGKQVKIEIEIQREEHTGRS